MEFRDNIPGGQLIDLSYFSVVLVVLEPGDGFIGCFKRQRFPDQIPLDIIPGVCDSTPGVGKLEFSAGFVIGDGDFMACGINGFNRPVGGVIFICGGVAFGKRNLTLL